LSVLARQQPRIQSVIRGSIGRNEKPHSAAANAETPSYYHKCDPLNANHMLPSLTPCITCSFFQEKSPHFSTQTPPRHHSNPPSSPLAPAAVNSRIPVCESVHPSLFSLLSPLHPSIPFFYVCSAVKPSWIRPASLVTCSLCWC